MGRKPNARRSAPKPPKKTAEKDSDTDDESATDRQKVHQSSRAKDSDHLESSSSSAASSEAGSDSETENLPKAKTFSDENAKWLKPKSVLLSDGDDDDDDDDGDSAGSSGDDNDNSNDEDEEEEEELEIEKEARLIDEENALTEKEAAEEMRRTVEEHTAIYQLPRKQDIEQEVDRVVPPSEIRSHIESILEVLAEFKSRREPGRARKEYIDVLGHFLAEQNGYLPELIEYFLTMFSPSETVEFVHASDKPRPLVIRTNTLKARRKDLAASLIKRGVSLDPLASWSKVGLKIVESPVPVGATPEYLSGMYMLQSAASMCPVLALDPEPNERILDMSAAPGGKTSYIAQLMRNTGCLYANDLKPDRQKATVANLHRLGVTNAITCTYDGRKLGHIFRQQKLDRILLDAPCSGLGVISRDPSVKVQRTLADVHRTAHLQKELLLAAIDALKCTKNMAKPKVLVYSTCSVSVAENEQVVQYALGKRDIQLLDTGLDFGNPGFTRYQQYRFHPKMALTRRFYPHVHNMDGFFVSKIIKLSDERPKESGTEPAEESAPAKSPTKTSSNKTKKRTGDTATKEKSGEKVKRSKVSIPPKSQHKPKKEKTNRSVTKPRRVRHDKTNKHV